MIIFLIFDDFAVNANKLHQVLSLCELHYCIFAKLLQNLCRNLQWQNLSISTSLLWYFWTLRLFPTNKNSINKGPPVWRKPFQCRSKTNKKTTDKIMGPTLKSQTYTTNLPNKARWWETLCVVIFIGNLWFAMCVKIQNFPNTYSDLDLMPFHTIAIWGYSIYDAQPCFFTKKSDFV